MTITINYRYLCLIFKRNWCSKLIITFLLCPNVLLTNFFYCVIWSRVKGRLPLGMNQMYICVSCHSGPYKRGYPDWLMINQWVSLNITLQLFWGKILACISRAYGLRLVVIDSLYVKPHHSVSFPAKPTTNLWYFNFPTIYLRYYIIPVDHFKIKSCVKVKFLCLNDWSCFFKLLKNQRENPVRIVYT